MNNPKTETIILPFPPSVNAVYRTKAFISKKTGKPQSMPILSEQGRKYVKEVEKIIAYMDKEWFGKARLKVEIFAFASDERRRDLGNLDKILMDSLQKSGVYENDCQIDDQRFIRGKKCYGVHPTVLVVLTEITKDERPECECIGCKEHYYENIN